uniref:DnaJ family domain-containing protein n=1 Tax=Shigella sp. FC1967 TaxID=1898041 RepID=UPI00094559B1|nr:DnaJ family domain-containing protein [Shigella sp. FC1967]
MEKALQKGELSSLKGEGKPLILDDNSHVPESLSEKRRKPSPSAGGDIRRKGRRALKINQALTGSERRL